MARYPDHPNEPGKWSRLESADQLALWRRDRQDPFPVIQFYVLAPPRQTEVFYAEDLARSRFDALAGKAATQAVGG